MSNVHANIDNLINEDDIRNLFVGFHQSKSEGIGEGDFLKGYLSNMAGNKLLNQLPSQFGDENVNVGFNLFEALQERPSFNFGANLGKGVSANLGLRPQQPISGSIRADLGNNLVIEGLLNQYMPELFLPPEVPRLDNYREVPQKYGIKISKGF